MPGPLITRDACWFFLNVRRVFKHDLNSAARLGWQRCHLLPGSPQGPVSVGVLIKMLGWREIRPFFTCRKLIFAVIYLPCPVLFHRLWCVAGAGLFPPCFPSIPWGSEMRPVNKGSLAFPKVFYYFFFKWCPKRNVFQGKTQSFFAKFFSSNAFPCSSFTFLGGDGITWWWWRQEEEKVLSFSLVFQRNPSCLWGERAEGKPLEGVSSASVQVRHPFKPVQEHRLLGDKFWLE